MTSKSTRAKWIVENNGVHLNQGLRVFNVQDETQAVNVVNLFPSAKCSCLEEFDCVHIMAVKLVIGMEVFFK